MSVPDPYALVLLALGAMRLARLLGWDSLLERPRSWLTGWTEKGDRRIVRPGTATAAFRPDRKALMTFLHCPWCFGFWVAIACWGGFEIWPRATLVAMAPLALSAIVGLVVKNLDE
jgi:hypothetical protein